MLLVVFNSLLRLARSVQRRRQLPSMRQCVKIVSYWHCLETQRMSARLLYTTAVRLGGSARNTKKKLVSSLTRVTLLSTVSGLFSDLFVAEEAS